MDEGSFQRGKHIIFEVPIVTLWSFGQSFKAGIFTFGCFYRNTGAQYQSTYGSVTDAQMFSRELSDEEMIQMTTCK